jgi:hypothetical protein
MLRQAIRENWPAPLPVCAAALRDVVDVALTSDNPRRMVAAVRVVIAMEADNQKHQLAALEARCNSTARSTPSLYRSRYAKDGP